MSLLPGRAGTILLAAFVAALAVWIVVLPDEQDLAFLKSLQPIKIVHHTQLPLEQFRRRHVLAGEPVIIDFNDPKDGMDSMKPPWLPPDEVLRVCGDKNVTLLADGVRTTLNILDSNPLFQAAFHLTFGESVAAWRARVDRLRPLGEFVHALPHDASAPPPTLPAWMRLLARLSPHLAKYTAMIGVLYYTNAASPYLADYPIAWFCPQLLKHASASPASVVPAQYLDADWLGELADRPRGSVHTGHDWIRPTGTDAEWKIFWGGPFSQAYPLHRDHGDGDVFTYMLSGCKEVVVLQNPEGDADALSELRITGTTGYGVDVFNYRAALVGGFTGMLQPGQLLYFPADMRHSLRNRCANSVAYGLRPWKTSAVRHTRKTLRAPL